MRGLLGLLLLIGVASALKFDVQAHPGRENQKKERCIRNFVAKETLVVVTAIVGGSKGDGMQLNIHVCSPTVILTEGAESTRKGQWLIRGCCTDSRRRWQRIRKTERCGRRVKDRLYLPF